MEMDSKINKTLRWIIVGALTLAALVPLYVSNQLFFPFISGKNFAFRILIEIAFASWLILAFREPSYRPRKTGLMLSVIFFISALAISVFLAEDPYKAFWSNFERMEGFIEIAHFALAFLVAGSVFNLKNWRHFVLVSLGVNAVIIIYAFLQYFGFFTINQGGTRVDATFGNAIYLGVYAMFHLFFSCTALYYAFIEKRKRFFIWFFAALALGNVSLVFLSATRGAILGLFVGFLSVCVFCAFSSSASRAFKRAGLVGILLLIISIGGFFALRETSLKNHPIFGRILSSSLSSDDSWARYIIWNMSLKGFSERPLFGWGQEGFNFVFNKYYDTRLYNREAWFDRAHNAYLDWLIAAGIFGLVGYLALWFFATRVVLKLSFAERVTFIGFGASYAINNIFVFDNGVSHFFFFMLLAYLYHKNMKDVVYKSDNIKRNKVFASIYVSVVIIALTFSIYYFNAKPAYAGKLLLEALHAHPKGPEENLAIFRKALAMNTFANAEIREQLAQVTAVVAPIPTVPMETKQEFLIAAAQEMDKEIKKRPTDARYYTMMGVLLDTFQIYEQGFLYWREALAHSPRKQSIFFQIGANRLNSGKINEAVEYLKRAYELNHDNREAVILYATMLIYTNNRAVEKEVLLTSSYANSSRSPADPRILIAYKAMGRTGDAIALLRKELLRSPKDKEIISEKIRELQSGK